MKLSVFYDHILEGAEQSGKSVKEILKLCKSWGIDGLEIRRSTLEENPEELTAAIEEADMQVSCIFEFYEFGNGREGTDFESQLLDAKRHIDLACRLGAHRILIVPGTLNEKEAEELNRLHGSKEETYAYMDQSPAVQSIRKALAALVEYGKSMDVLVTLEDFDGPVQPYSKIYQLLWFMEHVPGIRYALDTGNFAYSDEDVKAACEILKEYIVHVHCKDRRADETPAGEFNRGLGASPVGGGYIPVGELVEKLKSRGYEGYLAIEHYNAPDQVEYIRKSAEYLGRFM